jgi:hypothetical protein
VENKDCGAGLTDESCVSPFRTVVTSHNRAYDFVRRKRLRQYISLLKGGVNVCDLNGIRFQIRTKPVMFNDVDLRTWSLSTRFKTSQLQGTLIILMDSCLKGEQRSSREGKGRNDILNHVERRRLHGVQCSTQCTRPPWWMWQFLIAIWTSIVLDIP